MPRTKITDEHSNLSPVERALKNFHNACLAERSARNMKRQHEQHRQSLLDGKYTGTDVELTKKVRKDDEALADANVHISLTTSRRKEAANVYIREYVAAEQAKVQPVIDKRIQHAREVATAALAFAETLNKLHEDDAELRRLARTTVNMVNAQQHIFWIFNMVHEVAKFDTPYAGGGAFKTVEEFPAKLGRFDSEKLERMTAERCQAEASDLLGGYLEVCMAEKPEAKAA